jgi:hypothetical protein
MARVEASLKKIVGEEVGEHTIGRASAESGDVESEDGSRNFENLLNIHESDSDVGRSG